jgi:hypothetical protein
VQTRGRDKVFSARAFFPRPLEVRSDARARQNGDFFAARLLQPLLEMLLEML